MLVNVIRPFPFSRDGRTQEHAVVSPDPQDIPDALVVGLVSEGYVEQPEGLAPIPMSAGRRKVIVDRLTELFRAHMEALNDEQLTETLAAAERQSGYATKVVDDLEHGQPELFSVGPDLSGLAAIADADLKAWDGLSEKLLFDVQYRNPTTGEQITSKGVNGQGWSKQGADEFAQDLAALDEPAADIRIVPHVTEVTGDGTGEALPPIEDAAGEQTAPPAFDPDTADEAALRAFLTTRDGKEPDKRFGPDRLRALAKAAPGADDQGE